MKKKYDSRYPEMKPINQRGVDLSTDRAISDICGGRHLMDGVVGKHTKRTAFMTDGRKTICATLSQLGENVE